MDLSYSLNCMSTCCAPPSFILAILQNVANLLDRYTEVSIYVVLYAQWKLLRGGTFTWNPFEQTPILNIFSPWHQKYAFLFTLGQITIDHFLYRVTRIPCPTTPVGEHRIHSITTRGSPWRWATDSPGSCGCTTNHSAAAAAILWCRCSIWPTTRTKTRYVCFKLGTILSLSHFYLVITNRFLFKGT